MITVHDDPLLYFTLKGERLVSCLYIFFKF